MSHSMAIVSDVLPQRERGERDRERERERERESQRGCRDASIVIL